MSSRQHKYASSFVFGKYYPFHLGHKALIDYALELSEQVNVIVCASNKEKIPVKDRVDWIRHEYSEYPVRPVAFEYNENELENSSESSKRISKEWAEVFKKLLPDVEALITSEKYGEYVSHYMDIDHHSFDEAREIWPISASEIRKNIVKNWNFLPNSVKRYFQKIISIVGTESTGKSTLLKNLSDLYSCSTVDEIGREEILDSNNFTVEQLHSVAEKHALNILVAKNQLKPYVICDTDFYTTQSYSKFCFNQSLEVRREAVRESNVDLRLLLENDVPFVQDGTRMDEASRNALQNVLKSVLEDAKCSYLSISGEWDDRLQKSRDAIDKLDFGF